MRKYINIILTFVFLAFVLAVFAVTTAKNLPWLSWRFFKGHTAYLSENASVFQNAKARITALQDGINDRIYLKTDMMHLNARFQSAVGKSTVELGGKQAVRLSTGGYYDLFTDKANNSKVDEIIAFAKETGIPTAFVYCHGGVYEEGMLDETLYSLDTAGEFADSFTSAFRNAGISVTDSREVYKAAFLTPEDALLKSDVHWSHRNALETAHAAAENIMRDFGIPMNTENLLFSRFTDEVHEDLMFGEYGSRFGESMVPFDDIHVLYPSYETHVSYKAEKDGKQTLREGSFEEAVIERDKLEFASGKNYSTTAYYIYGDYLAETDTVFAEAGNDTTVLIFKDSFGTPVAGFLTLAAKNVHAVDLRSTSLSMKEIVEKVNPDCVIFAYSQQMMRNIEYAIQG